MNEKEEGKMRVYDVWVGGLIKLRSSATEVGISRNCKGSAGGYIIGKNTHSGTVLSGYDSNN